MHSFFLFTSSAAARCYLQGGIMKKLKCASFFAGVGGIDLGFEQTGAFEVIYANEFDPFAVKTIRSKSQNKSCM